MATVIKTENLSEEIVVNQFRDPLRNAAGGADSDTLTDPNNDSRDSSHPFIVTSFPDTEPLYPMLVVSEGGDSAGRIDRRADIHQHEYDVTVAVHAYSSTTLFSLRDGVRDWFENRIDTLASNGYEDAEIVTSSPASWDESIKAESWELTFRGKVHTE